MKDASGVPRFGIGGSTISTLTETAAPLDSSALLTKDALADRCSSVPGVANARMPTDPGALMWCRHGQSDRRRDDDDVGGLLWTSGRGPSRLSASGVFARC